MLVCLDISQRSQVDIFAHTTMYGKSSQLSLFIVMYSRVTMPSAFGRRRSCPATERLILDDLEER